MEITLCGASSFAYYRIPPQILGLYPALYEQPDDPGLHKFAQQPLMADALGIPIHRLVTERNHRSSGKYFMSHLMLREPPPGSFRQTEHGFDVTSPELTLLNLATSQSRIRLLMAAYELCGSFTVFHPQKRTAEQLTEAERLNLIPPGAGWERVNNTTGGSSDLWKRPPLLTPEAIRAYAAHVQGLRGVKALRWTADHVSGTTASPFEVEASMLLSLPRRLGGLGLSIRNNVRIPLSESARSIYDKSCCYADILLESQTDSLGVVFECQGHSVHDSEAASISDSNRATALEAMGYDVVLVTHEQLKQERSFAALTKLLYKKMGLPYRAKTAAEFEAEQALRRELFIDWSTLV